MSPADDVDAAIGRARAALADSRAAGERALRELDELLQSVRAARPRGQLQQMRWDCLRALGRQGMHFGQAGQDAWLERHVFRGQRDGVFVEIGGFDGVTGSNCLFFELMRGWRGLLVEPSPRLFEQARAARRCDCHQAALAASAGEAEFLEIRAGYTQMGGLVANYDPGMRQRVEQDRRHQGEVIRVPTRTLVELLDEAGHARVDYISLDVEGAELAVLEGFDFERYPVRAWTIENNRGDVTRIPAFMAERGYDRVEALGADDVYVRRDW